MKGETKDIPEDIILKIRNDFKGEKEIEQAMELIHHVRTDVLNVGWVQLSRAILLLAEGKVSEMRKIIDSRYYGDPRDVIMAMMAIPGNSNKYGLTEFGKE